MMFDQYKNYIKEETLKEYPLEAVFLITKNGCKKVDNIAKDPKSSFAVKTRDIANAQKEGLLAVVHSHPDYPAYPSHADMQTQLNYKIPFGLLATDGKSTTDLIWWGDSVPTPDLKTRTFRYGVTDCWSYIRDYYKINLGINLKDYAREWDFWKNGNDLYTTNLNDAGFYKIDDIKNIKPNDIFLCNYRSRIPNHGGIYIGDGLISHHMTSRDAIDISRHPSTEPLHRHRNHISAVYRFKDFEND